MTPETYVTLAMRTKCSQINALARMNTNPHVNGTDGLVRDVNLIQLNHAIVGLQGDVGELASALEKHVYYGQDFDYTNCVEELGDIMWYIAEVCDALKVDLGDVMERNLNKLQSRYPDKFDEDLAKEENRDREAERIVIEQKNEVFLGLDSHKLARCPSCKQPISDEIPEVCPQCGYYLKVKQG